jgi:serine/threonine protein kinase
MPGSNPPLAPDARAGRKLGKYEILSRLSTGGMSEIFLAFQRGLGGFRKIVVLKQILPDIKGEEEFVRMFLDEARITGMFSHPNIGQVFDLDIADGELFLAMEFVPGATLVEVARACRQANEPIPIGFTMMAVRDTALALHYAHNFTDPAGRSLTVIHRDIAEKNIMVTFEGVTKLLDFGIAKNPDWSNRTSIGMVKGTSGYMSPEQLTGQKLDGRTDIFSLGVVFHECLTGMRLFPTKTSEDSVLAVLREDAHPPSRQNRAVTPEIDAVVLRALARNREERYVTALELARAIERAAPSQLWLAEQAGALIKRFFADRREQTRRLLDQNTSGETTAEVQLSELLARHDSMPHGMQAQPAPSKVSRRLSSPDAQTDPRHEAPPQPGPPLTAKPTNTRSRRRFTGSGNPAVGLEPKTVLEAPPPARPRPPPEAETVQGVPSLSVRREEQVLDDGPRTLEPEPISEVVSPFQDEATATARRSAVRRTAGPILLGAVLALVVIGAGIWMWAPLRTAPATRTPEPPTPTPPPAAVHAPEPAAPEPPPANTAPPAAQVPVRLEPVAEEPPKAHPDGAGPSAVDVAKQDTSGSSRRGPGKGKQDTDRRRRPSAKAPPDSTAEPAEGTSERKSASKVAEATSAADAPGQLSLETEPKATVRFKSQELGNTPLLHRSLPVGSHLLTLIDANGRAFQLRVEIKSGALTQMHAVLAELPAADGP